MKDIKIIEKMYPCDDGKKYLKSKKIFKEAWDDCDRGDWMLWISAELNVDLKLFIKAKTLCALTVKHLMKDERSIKACEIALLFSEGKASKEDLDDASRNADSAYDDVYDDYFSTDTDTAAVAAAAISAAYAVDTNIVVYVAHAASSVASYAADAASAGDDRKLNEIETANICREILTDEVFKLWEEKLNYEKNNLDKTTFTKRIGETQFDWDGFVNNDPERITKKEWLLAEELADYWGTNPCGNQSDLVPRADISGEPLDNELIKLSLLFWENIYDKDLKQAKGTLENIKKRSYELVKLSSHK